MFSVSVFLSKIYVYNINLPFKDFHIIKKYIFKKVIVACLGQFVFTFLIWYPTTGVIKGHI